MADRWEIFSNAFGLTVICCLVAFIATLPARPAEPEAGPPGEITIALEAAPEPEPPPPAAQEEPAPAPETPPTPPPPEPPAPPPPPPPTPEPPAPPEQPPDPPEQLIDEEGAPVAPTPELPAVSEEVASAFRTCLQKRARYPSTKAARKQKPHGVVSLKISLSQGEIVNIEITNSSGSPILDQAARSTVLNSGCGSLGESGVVTGTIAY